jgi:CheY-like chemotaxis protein
MLNDEGYNVRIAQDGVEAVQRAQAEDFDLVLMDVQMPRMDGLQATAAIRELARESSLPIIAMTARRIAGDRERCLAAGVDAFLTKPIDRSELLELIDGLTNHDQPILRGATVLPTKKGTEDGMSTGFTDGHLSHRIDEASPSAFDLPGTLKRLGGDRALLAELVRMFKEDSPLIFNRLIAGAEAQRSGQIKHAAHKLRGLASNFGDSELTNTLQKIEHLAEHEQTNGVFELVERAGQQRATLESALEPYR